MREDGIHFGAGRGKLQVTGREQILFHAPEISLDAVQKIGQYKMESMAKEKAGMLYPRGGGNPATGGDGYGVGELQNEYNALSSQGILAGTEYEYYKPFDDAPEYEEYKDVPTWLKVVAGVAVAAVVGLAVGALVVATGGLAAAALGVTAVQLGMTAGVLTAGAGIAAVAATAASDRKNGTESSMGDYISNAFSASARVGASCIAITLGMYGAEVMTMTVSGGLGLIPVGGTVVPLPQLAGAFQFVAGTVTSQNLLFQMEEVRMFCASGKEMGAPTGNWMHDSARDLTEMASMQFTVYGLMNPYTYQRPKITPLPNETGLTVPGGTGVAVVPNGTASALNPPYLPGQYTEYPAAVRGWAQQALPGGGSAIESGRYSKTYYEGTTKVGGQINDISRIVYQRNDIDWNRIDPATGLTNKQLAQAGSAPYANDGTKIELHHLLQQEPGPMVEIPASLHDKYYKTLHGLVGDGESFRNNQDLEKQYNNFRAKYWRWRAKNL